ncbi:MAG: peptidoglycan-associated lipoprotein Pal [Nitrospirae bacterium]|nr:peptidoglycan-associated lipoprotein Pal [Nitrospirota bacterium]
MQVRNHIAIVIVAGIGAALLLSGCPKKVETAKEPPKVKEEKVTPPAEKVQPAAPTPQPTPPIAETPVAKEAEKPSPRAQDVSDVYFDYDKYNIRDDARAVLENTARWLNDHQRAKLSIEGHCDERGTNEYNLALGERRAKAVKAFLAALGVHKDRLSTLSYGEERPVCKEQNEECYAKNRRAHFVIQ